MKLLGWSSFFEEQIDGNELVARVVTEQRNSYDVCSVEGELRAELSGKLRFHAQGRIDLPVVGDWVKITVQPGEFAIIEGILERKNKISRQCAGAVTEEQVIAANIDIVFIVTSLNEDFNSRRLERYLLLVWESQATPVIVLTKSDLCEDNEPFKQEAESIAYGTPIHVVSAEKNEGIEELFSYLPEGKTAVLVGSSGVGKSTLINKIVGWNRQSVREIRKKDGRGRHSTTYRELIQLSSGGMIIDTPGMRELQLWDGEEGFRQSFEDISLLANRCKFRNCQHSTEPGCAIQEALLTGELDGKRYQNYLKLQRELSYLTRKQEVHARITEEKRWKKLKLGAREHFKRKFGV